ncbi:xanthine dehydrogenase family protein molybdopterin-binding subunit [Pseudonocardia xishanensis]|uniref:Molybdopterin-dependent oxidoreductase n=1 Tax=Pseudonocardia xishanensis TaxID=630995 RepID=A0ABP8RX09_9PSEU
MTSVMEKGPRPTQYIGARVLRTEDPTFLTGQARYTDDITLPGMAEAAFLRSPHAHARIVNIDTSEAEKIDGVLGVFTGRDLNEVVGKFTAGVPGRTDVNPQELQMIPADKARFVGDLVAVVVATSRYIAEDAVDLIDVEWEVLPHVIDPEAALEPDAPVLHEELGHNNFAHIEYKKGDVDRLFEEADHVFSKRFHAGRFSPSPLETRGVIADYNTASGEVVVWTSSQSPHLVRSLIAPPLGIAESRIRVIAGAVGGGFGEKCHVFQEEVIIPALSKLVGRPVKWIEDRYENLAASLHAKEIITYMDIACTSEGKFLAFRARYVGVNGAYQSYPWTALVEAMTTAAALPSLYAIEGVQYTIDCPYTNRCPIGAYRAVGRTAGTSARESLIDDIARELQIDPVELRLRNTIPNEPYVSLTGAKYDGGTYRECTERARDLANYDQFRERQRRLREEEGRYIGIAFVPSVEPSAWGSDMGKVNGYLASEIFDAATVTIEPDGSVSVTCGLHNHGQGIETSLAQVAADRLGVRLESVRVTMGDTRAAPYGFGTHSSRAAVVGGGCVLRASGDVQEKMAQMAANMLEVSAEDIEWYDGVASVKGVPTKTVTIAEVAAHAYYGGRSRPADLEPALTATRSYDPLETWPNSCVAAEVEVDIETGRVDVTRFWSVEDCGVMLNPMIVEGQTVGAIAQGIGGALLEDLAYDPETGQFLAGSLMDYLYPSATEVPEVIMEHLETPSPVTEGGMKGMGEGGLSVAPAAVLNAVADALSPLGVNVERSPLPPNTVLGYIREAGRAAEAGEG